MNDRHLDVIEKNTMDNVSVDSEMLYIFNDGYELKCERLDGKEEDILAKKHEVIDTIKRADSI